MTETITTANGSSFLFQGDASTAEPITGSTIEGMSAEDIANFRRWFQISPRPGSDVVMGDEHAGFPKDQMAIMINPASYRFLRSEMMPYTPQARPESSKGWYQRHNRRGQVRSHKTRIR